MATCLEPLTCVRMPTLGLGTWQSLQGTARDAVKFAVNVGCWRFDRAYLHQNESEIGDALREKIGDEVVRREDLFIVSKAGEELFPADGNGTIIPSDTDFLGTWEEAAATRLPQEKLIKFCRSQGISVTACCPLGVPNWPWSKPEDISLFEDPQITEIAFKYNKTLSQVLIRLQRKVSVIPKSVTPHYIKDNFKM